MSNSVHGLGTLQSEVMELVWERQEATVAQLVEAIGRRRPVTYTTVLSAVQKLDRKGWLKHRTEGRAYVYSAARKRADAGRRTLRELLQSAFSGDPRLLLSSLIEEADLSDAALAELRQLIDERRRGIAKVKTRPKKKGHPNG